MNGLKDFKEIELSNVNIDIRQTQYGKDYFIIGDQDETSPNKAYFVFRGENNLNHEDFERFKENYMTITRIKLTYYEKEYKREFEDNPRIS